MMCGGRCSCTAAVGVEGDSCLKEMVERVEVGNFLTETVEKAEVGRIVIAGLESQVRKEGVGMIGLAWVF